MDVSGMEDVGNMEVGRERNGSRTYRRGNGWGGWRDVENMGVGNGRRGGGQRWRDNKLGLAEPHIQ